MKLHVKITILIATVAILEGVFNVYLSGVNIKQVLQQDLESRASAVSQKVLSENTSFLDKKDFATVTANIRTARRQAVFYTNRSCSILPAVVLFFH